MSFRGTPLRSRARLACLTLAVGLAVGVLAPAAAAETISTPAPSASAESSPEATSAPVATDVPVDVPVEVPAPVATEMPVEVPAPTAVPTPGVPAPATEAPSPAPASGDTDPACPNGERAVDIDFDAITIDWTARPGFAQVTLPESSFPDCAYSADIILVAEGPNGEYSGGIGTTVAVDRDGSPARTVSVLAPSGERTIVVVTKLYGMKDGSYVDLASERWRSAPGVALEACTTAAVTFAGDITVASAPGTLTLSVPAREATGCYDEANIGYFVTQDNGAGVALDTVEQVPTTGLPARTITVDLPYSAEWTVSVQTSGVNNGAEILRSEVLRRTVPVLSVFDTCAVGLDRSQSNEPFTVDAVGGVGRIDVTVGALALPACFDELEFRVLVKKVNNDDEQAGVELGPLQSDATFDGATVSGTFAPGRYFVVVFVSAVVDGEYGDLFQVFAPSVNQPDDEREFIQVTGAVATTSSSTGGHRLAATGVDAGGAGLAAALLLATGLIGMSIARRRRVTAD